MVKRAKISLVICSLLLITSSCFNIPAYSQVKRYQIEATVYKLCQEGKAAIDQKDFAKARDIFLEAAKSDPTSNSKYVHTCLSQSYLQLREFSKAITEAQIVLKLDPNNAYALYIISKANYEMGNFDEAARYLQKSNNTDRANKDAEESRRAACNISAYANLQKATQCIKSNNDVEATMLLQSAIDCDPTPVSSHAHASLSFVYRRRGYLQRAIQEGNRALALNPQDKATVYNIAMAYRDQGHFDDAISWMNRYLTMETDQTQRQNALACLKSFQLDKANLQNPDNRLPDYLDESLAQGHTSKWNQDRLPLKLYISSGAGTLGYLNSYKNIMLLAFDAWCTASHNKLAYVVVNDKSKADIVVQWTSTPFRRTTDHPNTRKCGETLFRFNDLGDIQEATITILTVNPFNGAPLNSDGECASICIHEVGHALGLGHSPKIADIMYFCTSTFQNGLSTRDKATLSKLYLAYPPIAFVPRASTLPNKIEYLPVPEFMPPLPPDTSKLEPPLFEPPPARQAEPQPPFFTPPALSKPASNESLFFAPPKK